MDDESNDVHCFMATLSEHDLDSVKGLSRRAVIFVSAARMFGEVVLYTAFV